MLLLIDRPADCLAENIRDLRHGNTRMAFRFVPDLIRDGTDCSSKVITLQ